MSQNVERDTQLQWGDYTTMLNPVEHAFTALLDRELHWFKGQRVKPHLTRERWGGLQVEVSWHGRDRIHRQIVGEFDVDKFFSSPQRLELAVSAAAFKTATGEPYGSVTNAKTSEFGRFALPLTEESKQAMQDAVNQAFASVSTLTENDLEPRSSAKNH